MVLQGPTSIFDPTVNDPACIYNCDTPFCASCRWANPYSSRLPARSTFLLCLAGFWRCFSFLRRLSRVLACRRSQGLQNQISHLGQLRRKCHQTRQSGERASSQSRTPGEENFSWYDIGVTTLTAFPSGPVQGAAWLHWWMLGLGCRRMDSLVCSTSRLLSWKDQSTCSISQARTW